MAALPVPVVGDTLVHPETTTNHRPSSFDFDDAFSDGDDHDEFPGFSPDTIREVMAKHRETEGEWAAVQDGPEAVHANGFFEAHDLDTCVSTIDLDRPSLDTRSVSTSRSSLQSQEDSGLPHDLSHISLSGAPDETQNHEELSIPYPAVIIDASQPPSNRVEVISERLRSANLQPEPLSSDQEGPPSPPHSGPPSSSAGHSAPSPSSSSPGPSSTSRIHRQTRSVGPTTFQKVMSKTRPTFLPPKSRREDKKHMADWESMMKQSRAAAEKKRKTLQERRIAREKKVEESLHIWEKEILPDWRVVNKNPALRRLWWNGIPSKLRASMWERAVGNALALSKDTFRTCLARAKRALSVGTFPTTTLGLIEQDVEKTLPALHIFHPETGPLYQDLKDMLCAWVVSRSDEGLGYTPGISRIAAMVLISMPPQQGFIVMRNLLERHCMRSFYGGMGSRDDVEAYFRIFDTLLADGMPKIYFNFKQHQISPSAYLPDWLLPLFLDHLPFEACARLWDVLLLEGDSFLFRAALGILAVLEPRLFFPDRQELLELLKGENKPALEVAKREGRSMNGGKYEIYRVDEETLWDRIDSMEEWWKESTWTRLIHRELPDL